MKYENKSHFSQFYPCSLDMGFKDMENKAPNIGN